MTTPGERIQVTAEELSAAGAEVVGIAEQTHRDASGFSGTQDAISGRVTVENRENGFRMSLQESSQGDLSIGASSPCVWPDGTPAPRE